MYPGRDTITPFKIDKGIIGCRNRSAARHGAGRLADGEVGAIWRRPALNAPSSECHASRRRRALNGRGRAIQQTTASRVNMAARCGPC